MIYKLKAGSLQAKPPDVWNDSPCGVELRVQCNDDIDVRGMYLGDPKGSKDGVLRQNRFFPGGPMFANLELFDRCHDSVFEHNCSAETVGLGANAEDSHRHETALAIARPKAPALG